MVFNQFIHGFYHTNIDEGEKYEFIILVFFLIEA